MKHIIRNFHCNKPEQFPSLSPHPNQTQSDLQDLNIRKLPMHQYIFHIYLLLIGRPYTVINTKNIYDRLFLHTH